MFYNRSAVNENTVEIFLVLTAASMKVRLFWILHHAALMMEAVSTSEMSVNSYEATCCNIPEDSDLENTILY
jgi:hypothetical protein